MDGNMSALLLLSSNFARSRYSARTSRADMPICTLPAEPRRSTTGACWTGAVGENPSSENSTDDPRRTTFISSHPYYLRFLGFSLGAVTGAATRPYRGNATYFPDWTFGWHGLQPVRRS